MIRCLSASSIMKKCCLTLLLFLRVRLNLVSLTGVMFPLVPDLSNGAKLLWEFSCKSNSLAQAVAIGVLCLGHCWYDSQDMGLLHIPALRRSCSGPSGCLGNETVFKQAELVLEMIFGGRTLQPGCSLHLKATEGTKRRSLWYTTCIYVYTTL